MRYNIKCLVSNVAYLHSALYTLHSALLLACVLWTLHSAFCTLAFLLSLSLSFPLSPSLHLSPTLSAEMYARLLLRRLEFVMRPLWAMALKGGSALVASQLRHRATKDTLATYRAS